VSLAREQFCRLERFDWLASVTGAPRKVPLGCARAALGQSNVYWKTRRAGEHRSGNIRSRSIPGRCGARVNYAKLILNLYKSTNMSISGIFGADPARVYI